MNVAVESGRHDFWKSSGFHLTERMETGALAVSADLLRAYFTRPEVHPVDDSCDDEHRLFEALMADPFRPVGEDELAAIRDPDAIDNYRIVLRFRDHLVASGSIEAAYTGLIRDVSIKVPPAIIDQLVHMVVRSMLDGEGDPMRQRAAELLFRDQTVSTDDGQSLLADAEIVEMISETGGLGGLGALLVESGTPTR
ncbi:MAG TPA: DUF6352 family protein, partial [Afifellaceae bacterium]|nr:DUF6352 family protein [Afifellaceae bacterium]